LFKETTEMSPHPQSINFKATNQNWAN